MNDLRRTYDDQLRLDAEVVGATRTGRLGPLVVAEFDDVGFVSYRSLEGVGDVDALIAAAQDRFRGRGLREVEWKTRGHDAPADLGARLTAHGFAADEVETVMVGDVAHLDVPVPLAPGMRVRRAGDGGDLAEDVTRAATLQREVFGGGPDGAAVLARLARADGRATLWLVEAGAEVVAAGRLEIVPGTDFAGLWGGACAPAWRGRGLYRALTAARARYAREHGVALLHSDCSPMSRPILERAGLTAVTTTTPYLWTP